MRFNCCSSCRISSRERAENTFSIVAACAENWGDDGFSAGGQSHDANPAVLSAFGAAHQSFGDQPIDGHADRSGRQIDFRADHIDGQRSLVKQGLKDGEIRKPQAGFVEVCQGISRNGLHRLHHHQPCMHGGRSIFFHRSCPVFSGFWPIKSLTIPQSIILISNMIDFNMDGRYDSLTTLFARSVQAVWRADIIYQWNSRQKGEPHEDSCDHRAIFAGARFHRLWFERFSAFYSAAAAALRTGRTVFHGHVYIALPGFCVWAAIDRWRVVSLSTDHCVGVDHHWAVDRQHSAFPCADGSEAELCQGLW